jgi:hypothetical protein
MTLSRQALRQPIRRSLPLLLSLLVLFSGMSPLSANSRPQETLGDLLELRGYTRIGGVLEFSIFNRQEKRSEWLRVNEEHRGYKIESYDPATNTIVIRYNNRIGTLHLQAARIADYVEPARESDSQPAVPSRPSPAAAEARRPTTPGTASRHLPPVPPARQRSQDNPPPPTAPFMSRSHSPSGGALPPAPPTQPPAVTPGNPADDSAAAYWATMSSPPPLPPTAPPSYSPEG